MTNEEKPSLIQNAGGAAKNAIGIGLNAVWQVGGRVFLYGFLSAVISAMMIYTLHAQLLHAFRLSSFSWLLYVLSVLPFIAAPFLYGFLAVQIGLLKTIGQVLLDNAQLEAFARDVVQGAMTAVSNNTLGKKALEKTGTMQKIVLSAAERLTTSHSGVFARGVQQTLGAQLSMFLTAAFMRIDLSDPAVATNDLVLQLKANLRGFLDPSYRPLWILIALHFGIYIAMLIFLR
ncbi:MAG: hypothetical protein IAF08_10380 [Rhizobacter sp.]|nr:hypothetical protein [Chlorobiales bacterium]